jgi:hypothetical protein
MNDTDRCSVIFALDVLGLIMEEVDLPPLHVARACRAQTRLMELLSNDTTGIS